MCLCFNRAFTPVVVPSQKAKCLSTVLLILSICHMAMAVLYFSTIMFISNAVISILLGILLLSCRKSYSAYALLIYLFAVGMGIVDTFCYLGGLVQHGLLFKNITVQSNLSYRQIMFSEIVCMIGLLFSICCLIICFRAYKEFKALYIEQVLQRQQTYTENKKCTDTKFKGKGVMIG